MRIKHVVISLSILALACVLLYGTWILEESSKSIRSVVIGKEGDGFVVDVQKGRGDDLVIQCNEEEFEEAFRHFRNFLGVEGVPLSIPGGPLALSVVDSYSLPSILESAKRTAIEFLKRHSPERVVLLAHSECLLYDVLGAWQNQIEEVQTRQVADLRHAEAVLHGILPHSKIELWYAYKEGTRLKFEPVTLPEKETLR